MTYQDFLSQLIALGAKLPLLWPIILRIIDDFQQAWEIVVGHPVLAGAEPEQMSTAELEAEAHVAAIFDEHEPKSYGAAGPGGSIIEALRQAWAFIQANPALMQLIATFLATLLKSKA